MSITFRDTKGHEYTVETAPAELLRAAEKSDKASPAARAAAEAELNRRAELGGDEPDPEVVKAPAKPPAGTALVKASDLTFALTNVEAINQKLAELESKVILLSPALYVGELPEGFQLVSSVIRIDLSKNEKGYVESDDVVHMGGKKFMLSGTAMKRVQRGAAVTWGNGECGRTDDRSTMNVWEYTAVGYVTDIDGSRRRITGTYEVDLRDGSAQYEEIVEQAKERQAKPNYKGEVDGGKAAVRAKRRFGMQLAETGAKNRALCDMGFKRSYTLEELKKPIVAVRLMFTGKTDDPILKRQFSTMLAAQAIGVAMPALYPAAEPAQLPAPRVMDIPADDPTGPDGSEVPE
jgi:hypothetical protein